MNNCAVCYMSFANDTTPRLFPCGEGECGGDAVTCICQDCVHGWIDATHLFENMRCPCCRLPYHLQHLLKVCDRPHADKLLAAHAARAASRVRKNETRALLQRIPPALQDGMNTMVLAWIGDENPNVCQTGILAARAFIDTLAKGYSRHAAAAVSRCTR